MQFYFDEEMQLASKHAEQLAKNFNDYYNQLNYDVIAIQNLTKLNRILSDELRFFRFIFIIYFIFFRCNELIIHFNQEKDLVHLAEMIYELNSLLKANKSLRNINWFRDNLLFKITDLNSKTRTLIIEQLKSALSSLNNSNVILCLKSLTLIYEDQKQTIEKELSQIMDEGIRDLNSLFIQLNGANTSLTISSGGDKTSKLLSQLSNKLHSYLEQYQLLGFFENNFFLILCIFYYF